MAVPGQNPPAIEKTNRVMIRTLRLIASCFALDILLVGALAVTGTVGADIAVAQVALGIGFIGLFSFLVRSGLNRHFADPGMAGAQTVLGSLIQAALLLAAPQIGVIFLVNLVSIYMFGIIAFDVRRFLPLWLFGIVLIATLFFAVGDRIGLPHRSFADQAVMCIFFIQTLLRPVFVTGVVSNLRTKLAANNKALTAALQRVEDIAMHDELTGALNRRALMNLLDRALETVRRKKAPLCVAIVDIDYFKQINDTFGHAIGDEVLRSFAQTARHNLRVTDGIARFGGDEFVLVLPDIGCDDARIILDRIVSGIKERAAAGGIPPVTLSIGLAPGELEDSPTAVLERADAALYRAKSNGRDCMEIACLGSEGGADVSPDASPATASLS